MVDASHDLLSGPEQAEGAREGDRVVVGDPGGAAFDGVVPVLRVDEVGIDVRNIRRDLDVNAGRGKPRPPRCAMPAQIGLSIRASRRTSSVTIACAETTISSPPGSRPAERAPSWI